MKFVVGAYYGVCDLRLAGDHQLQNLKSKSRVTSNMSMQPGADVSQREQYGWMLPGGRETRPTSDPAGERHDWRYARDR